MFYPLNYGNAPSSNEPLGLPGKPAKGAGRLDSPTFKLTSSICPLSCLPPSTLPW